LVALVVLVAMVIAVTPIATGGAAPVLGEAFPVCTADYGQVQPDIDYPWIVWKDERESTSRDDTDIYAYNFQTGEESVVCTAAGEQSNPSVSGDWVVYSDDRADDGYCDIYAYNLVTKEERLVAGGGNIYRGNPAIDGDIIVHNYWDNTDSAHYGDIWAYDLSTDEGWELCGLPGQQREAEIADGWAVWRDERAPGYSIGGYDFAGSEVTTIAQSYYNAADDYAYYTDPSTDGGLVVAEKHGVWGEDSSSRTAIVLIDTETMEEVIISQETQEGDRRHPVISDGFVTWHDSRVGVYEVYCYDIVAEKEACIVPAVWDEAAGDGGEWVSWAGRTTTGDGIVAWHDHRVEDPAVNEDATGYDDLYAMYLHPLETVQNPVEGEDRYGTSVQVSEQTFPEGADTVIVTTGANWPDALAAASLAGAYGAPVLLTRPTELPEDIAAEIERLGATDAFILGSTSAVSNAVKAEVEAVIGGPATRLGGANRYETANLIAEETVDMLGGDWDGTAFVATGNNFPDALAASPLSSFTGYPIFLANADGISDETQAVMDDLGVADVYLLGSPGVLPAAAEAQVKTAGAIKVTRIAGDTRYETAVGAATFGVEELGMSWSQLAIATGENYPDALSAGPAQGLKGSVMLLTTPLTLHGATAAAIEANQAAIWQVDWVGSTAAISQAVRDAVEAIFAL
jgi:beta propeller repeat protein